VGGDLEISDMSARKHGTKSQHTVPRCYLKAWTDPKTPKGHTPYVWIVETSTGGISKKAPVNVFVENDIYTVRGIDGSRDLSLEHGLSGLEGRFDRIRRDTLEKHKEPAVVPRLELAAFVAALKWRTPRMRDHWRSQWAGVLKVAEDLEAGMKTASEEVKQSMASMPRLREPNNDSMSINEVRELITNTAGHIVPPGIEVWTSALVRMSMFVLCCDGRDGFITSDNPCIMWDHGPPLDPPFHRLGPTIFTKTIEITVPISPRQALVYSHRPVDFGYREASAAQIGEVNRRTAFQSSKELVANSESIARAWTQQRK
jgi:hypothetical protein